jgi:RNA polymerase sigma factor (sigma-70 family)
MSDSTHSNFPDDKKWKISSDRKLHVFRPHYMDDATLWNAFRNGDERAFITIFECFSRTLYNYGYKILSESDVVKDAIQDLFIELWKNRRRLGATTAIKYYLFKSLRRKLLRIHSKNSTSIYIRLTSGMMGETLPSHEFFVIADQVAAEKREQLIALLDKLTKRQREAIFLRYFEELGIDKIAGIMNLSKQGVYNLISQALHQLKRSLLLLLLSIM